MKRIFNSKAWSLFLVCITGCLIFSCKKTNTPGRPEEETELPGLVTGIGVPVGNVESTLIGANGGTFTTSDGALKIDVPAGAFTADQTVSVQPITNFNKAGTGTAYRIAPHGITFNKPVTITFNYVDSNTINTIPAALAIAYQDAKGIWQAPGNQQKDTAAKKVSVQTTHFSDWSLFKMLKITPSQGFVDPGGALDLRVVKTVSPIVTGNDFVIPMPSVPVTDTTGAVITDWSTAGGGFTFGVGSSATYHAPNAIPDRNPVAVTATVASKGNQKWLLVSNIYVGKEGFNYRMNDGPWVHAVCPVGAVKINDTLRSMQVGPNMGNHPVMSFTWLGGGNNQSQAWTRTFPAFNGSDGTNGYWHWMGPYAVVSPGSITFVDYHGEYVTGTVTLSRAGKMIPAVPPIWEAIKIEGFFRIKWKK